MYCVPRILVVVSSVLIIGSFSVSYAAKIDPDRKTAPSSCTEASKAAYKGDYEHDRTALIESEAYNAVSDAIRYNDIDGLKRLIKRNPSLIGQSNNLLCVMHPLSDAISYRSNFEVAKILYLNGADPNIVIASGEGEYQERIWEGAAINVYKHCKIATCDKTLFLKYNWLENFVDNGRKIIRYFVENGAIMNDDNLNKLVSPLFMASRFGDIKMMDFLVTHGADVNGQAKGVSSPLFGALFDLDLNKGADTVNKSETIKWLIDRGADPCESDRVVETLRKARKQSKIRNINVSYLISIAPNLWCDPGPNPQ